MESSHQPSPVLDEQIHIPGIQSNGEAEPPSPSASSIVASQGGSSSSSESESSKSDFSLNDIQLLQEYTETAYKKQFKSFKMAKRWKLSDAAMIKNKRFALKFLASAKVKCDWTVGALHNTVISYTNKARQGRDGRILIVTIHKFLAQSPGWFTRA